jgi:hypothetical protein
MVGVPVHPGKHDIALTRSATGAPDVILNAQPNAEGLEIRDALAELEAWRCGQAKRLGRLRRRAVWRLDIGSDSPGTNRFPKKKIRSRNPIDF